MNILLLHYLPPGSAQTTIEHARSFRLYSKHVTFSFDFFGTLPKCLDLSFFDVIIIHYTLVISWRSHIDQASYDRLRAYKGLKICFIQDEYRWVDKTVEALDELGIDILFTCVPEHEIEKVYPKEKLPHLQKVPTLTGYIEQALFQYTSQTPWIERPIDMGYRSREVPFWLGDMGQDKVNIAKRFLADAEKFALNCNIHYREIDRLYGQKWIDFLCRCKAVLGVESGASVVDLDGSIREKVDLYVEKNPGAGYNEVKKLFFADVDHRIKINAVSPRIFEACVLKTLMILYDGDYSGILTPWRHYVPLKKDHSNMAEVVSVLHDPQRALEIIENCYREVACNPNYTYRAFVKQFDCIVDEALKKQSCGALPIEYKKIKRNFKKAQRHACIHLYFYHLVIKIYLQTRSLYRVLLGLFPGPLQVLIHNACKKCVYRLKETIRKL